MGGGSEAAIARRSGSRNRILSVRQRKESVLEKESGATLSSQRTRLEDDADGTKKNSAAPIGRALKCVLVHVTAVQAAVQGQTGIASDYGEVVGRGAKQYDGSGSK